MTANPTRAALAAALALSFAAPAAHAQSPVEGDWSTAGGEGRVRIAPCAEKLCGWEVLEGAQAGRGRPILIAFEGGPEVWTRGEILDPDTGRRYAGRLSLTGPDRLKVTGCLAPPFCASQIWRRVPS